MHFLSINPFPQQLFEHSDIGQCEVYFQRSEFGDRSFYLTISGDPRNGKFYFSPPLSLDQAAIFGGETVLNEKERVFQTVNVSIKLNNEWLDEARRLHR